MAPSASAIWPIGDFQFADRPFFTQSVDDQTVGANSSVNAAFTSQWDDFLWLGSFAQSTGAFSTRVNAQYDGGYLDNDRVRSDLGWGTAQQPVWHAPKLIPRGSQITFEVYDRSGAQNKVRLYLVGCQAKPGDDALYGKGRGLFNLVTPAAGLSIPGNLTFYASIITETNYDLWCTFINAAATSSSWLGKKTYRDPRFPMKIPSSQNRLHSTVWTGTSQFPYTPRAMPIFAANNTIELDLLDESGLTNVVNILWSCERRPPASRC